MVPQVGYVFPVRCWLLTFTCTRFFGNYQSHWWLSALYKHCLLPILDATQGKITVAENLCISYEHDPQLLFVHIKASLHTRVPNGEQPCIAALSHHAALDQTLGFETPRWCRPSDMFVDATPMN